MNRSDVDWSVLRPALILMAGTLLLSGALIGGGYYFHEQTHSEYTQQQRRFQSMSRKYLAVDEEERLIRTYVPEFRKLEAAGILGEEQRLSWTETVRRVGAALRLPSVRYEIEPQKPYHTDYAMPSGSFKVYGSRMRLILGLLHEDDLFRFLDGLHEQAEGLFTVEKCTLSRTGATIHAKVGQPNVDAECDLMWLTLSHPDEGAKP